jgi:Zn-dependent M32 family carboxypeptidase
MKQFFSNTGLTSTSANYICNIAKEYLETLHVEIRAFKPYDTYMGLIDSSTKHLVSSGNTDIAILQGHIHVIADINGLVAWLREAIKQKDDLLQYAEAQVRYSFRPAPEYPQRPTPISKEDVMKEWSAEKLSRYYAIEAVAIHYGKYIHPKMPISEIKSDFIKKINNPRIVTGEGHDAMLEEYQPTFELHKINFTFMQLQQTYREAEKRLNSIKAEIKEAMTEKNRVQSSYYQQILSQYKADQALWETEFNQAVEDEIEKISQYKIVIPDQFREIYNFLNNLGKGENK